MVRDDWWGKGNVQGKNLLGAERSIRKIHRDELRLRERLIYSTPLS
jgi:hypothetical protein